MSRIVKAPPVSSCRNHRGFTLIEMAVALVVLGLVGILVVRWVQLENEQEQEVIQRSLIERADDALLAFTAAHARLPCPAADGNGQEDCSDLRASGYLPYATLGLPDQRAGKLHYTAQRRQETLSSVDLPGQPFVREVDVDLASAVNRAQALQVLTNQPDAAPLHQIATYSTCTEIPELCRSTPELQANGLDFCAALFDASQLPVSNQYAHSHVAGQPAHILGNVAYAIHLPADADARPALGVPLQRTDAAMPVPDMPWP